ncbi:MAG: bacterial regulatory helix-turn-helix, lysR family protein [Panacagrimonas sp.]|jgi:DNA-binding transcriptional LysR family regulator|nr:LysR family transcriptional regulator [Panacagrimonas sp.]MCC2656303.1 bacterial regulatory helix-turn-helix, lysR family protein [Panacagrimonas sp.]
MDVDLARTFLEIVSSGSFGAAAERLHLTQTAVSARVRSLEQQLGRPLFIRNKAGARLTAAGERFVRHARHLVHGWERARQQVALPPGRDEALSVGSEPSLWHPLLADWLIWMHHVCPEVALRADVDMPERLLDRVQDGTLDMAVLYNPPSRPGLVCELLMEEKLVLVSSAADGPVDPGRYVHVDWGPSFAINHQAAYPEQANPPVSISLGPLALTYLLTVGGAGYFRAGTVRPFIEDGSLFRVAGAPEFSHSAYVVHATGTHSEAFARAREGLQVVAKREDLPGPTQPVGARSDPSPAAG